MKLKIVFLVSYICCITKFIISVLKNERNIQTNYINIHICTLIFNNYLYFFNTLDFIWENIMDDN